MDAQMVPNKKIKFCKDTFLSNPTVEYLSMCDLDNDAMHVIIKECRIPNISCVKYLIDCWDQGMRDWNETFVTSDGKVNLFLHLCKNGHKETVEYILDIYIRNNFDLECKSSTGYTPLFYMCMNKSKCYSAINRLLDIYIERNLDFTYETPKGCALLNVVCRYCGETLIERVLDICIEKGIDLQHKSNDGWTPLHTLCSCGPLYSIKRVAYLYHERNYDLNCKTKNGFNFLQIVCRFNTMRPIKFMIDFYVEKALDLNCVLDGVMGLREILNANTHLRQMGVEPIQMYLQELERDVFL